MPSRYETCENCRFWCPKGLDRGQCRRTAPVKGWPYTDNTDWCGQHMHHAGKHELSDRYVEVDEIGCYRLLRMKEQPNA